MASISTPAQLTLIAQDDIALTKDPQLHLFRPINRTYTPLATQFHFHRPDGDVSGLPGETVVFSLRRSGDLLRGLYVRFRGPLLQHLYPTDATGTVLGPSTDGSTDPRYRFLWGPLSYYAIDSVSIQMNSTTIDTLYGDWMYVWSEFMQPTANRTESKTLATKMSTPDLLATNSCDQEHFFLPIPFWFTEHPSLALPLVALANTEIKCIITFARTLNKIPLLKPSDDTDGETVYPHQTLRSTSLQTIELVTEEVVLCQSEKEWFATQPQSYLITQHDQRDTQVYSLEKTATNSNASYRPNAETLNTSYVDPDITLSLENFRLPIRQLWVGKGGLVCKDSESSAPNVATFITDNRLVSGCFYQDSYIMNDSREITDHATVLQRSQLPFYQDGEHVGLSSSIKEALQGVAGQTPGNGTTSNQPTLISFSMGLDDTHPEGAINFSRLKSPRLVLKGAKLEAFPQGIVDLCGFIESNYVILAENYNMLDVRDGTAYLRYTD